MARVARGRDLSEQARRAIVAATTAEQLRQAQAVLFPIELGLSLKDTAAMIGLSVGWTCRLRNAFLCGDVVGDGSTPARGGRHHENLTREREREVLRPFLERARNGGVLVVPELKPRLEAELGRTMSLSAVYNLLHRHGWQKLARHTRHPASNDQAQQGWKAPPRKSETSTVRGRAVRRSS